LAITELTQPIRALSKLSELGNDKLLEIAEKAGTQFRQLDVTSSKIRKFQSQIVQVFHRSKIDASFDPSAVRLLKYHLAYAAAREMRDGRGHFMDFKDFFDAALDKVKDKADIDRLRQLYDATLSYHYFAKEKANLENRETRAQGRGPNRYAR
jgi:CRISPR type III-A-associated protein Csm2